MLDSKRRAIIFLIFAILFAAIAGFMFLQKMEEMNTELGEMVEIYVASTDIPSRALIQEEYFTTQEVPKKYVNDSYITDIKEMENKLTMVNLDRGDLITKQMLKPIENSRSDDNRFVSVYPSSNVQFDEALTYQDRADIIVAKEVDGEIVTELFMEDVPVAGGGGVTEDNHINGVLLEVSMEDAIRLIDAQITASHIRVLKANAGISQQLINEMNQRTEESTQNSEEKTNEEEAPKEEPEEEAEGDQENKDSGNS